MTNHIIAPGAVASLMLIGVMQATVAAQPQDQGLLRTAIEMPGTDEFVLASVVGHHSYVELDRLQFRVRAENESPSLLFVDQSALKDAFNIRVFGDSEIPIRVEWLARMQFEGAPDPVTVLQETVAVSPGAVVDWTATIVRLDGLPFGFGQYFVTLAMENLRRAIQTPDGKMWEGRLFEGTHQRVVSVRAPRNVAERVRMHELTASMAHARGDGLGELEAYSRAAAENPADTRASDHMALLYLLLGRYSEAVVAYEAIVARIGFGGESVPLGLAQAYVGVGDEGNAARVLRMAGIPENTIGAEVAAFRQRVRERGQAR